MKPGLSRRRWVTNCALVHAGSTTGRRHALSTEPLAISDFLAWRAFTKLEIYQYVCRPTDIADSLRLYLPPTPTTRRFFSSTRIGAASERASATCSNSSGLTSPCGDVAGATRPSPVCSA